MEKQKKKSLPGWVLVIIILGVLAVIGYLSPSSSPEETEGPVSEVVQEREEEQEEIVETIEYTVLSKGTNVYDDLNLDILISEDDVTEENIKALLKVLADENEKDEETTETAIIRVYQDERAWDKEYEDWDSKEYIEIFDKGYLVYYIKSPTTNEIRWMQEIGVLEDLMGTTTELK